MSDYFRKYNNGYRIVSIAKTEGVRADLIYDQLPFVYICGNDIILYPENVRLTCDESALPKICSSNEYDVYEIWENGHFSCCYDNASNENGFFITSQCNSNCIMCPSPVVARKKHYFASTDKLIEIARHIPKHVGHLTITGGEPFLLGRDIFRFIAFLNIKFEETEFLFLTNGRAFALEEYADLFAQYAPNKTVTAIPVHAAEPDVHDLITCAPGSYHQTLLGIKNLLQRQMIVEIRIVVSRININYFDNIVELISRDMKKMAYVSVIAMEMTGSAHDNADKLWIPYSRLFNQISAGIMKMIESGIDVRLYNFPLCTVDRRYWAICEKSISTNKRKYADICEQCKEKDACGGVFTGSFRYELGDLRVIR